MYNAKKKKKTSDLKISSSFDIAPDINSRSVDRAIQDLRKQTGGSSNVNELVRKNLKKTQAMVRGA